MKIYRNFNTKIFYKSFINYSEVKGCMGRIKTQLIKRLTFQLIKEHKDEFAKDFESNKKISDFLLFKPNKKIRNGVAGYLTKLMKHKEEL